MLRVSITITTITANTLAAKYHQQPLEALLLRQQQRHQVLKTSPLLPDCLPAHRRHHKVVNGEWWCTPLADHEECATSGEVAGAGWLLLLLLPCRRHWQRNANTGKCCCCQCFSAPKLINTTLGQLGNERKCPNHALNLISTNTSGQITSVLHDQQSHC